jgi:ATP-dependent DNA helicase RecG
MLDFKIANLAKDGELIAATRQLATHLLQKDAKLELPENGLLKQRLMELQKENQQWGRIS